jgi:hypothetical protein
MPDREYLDRAALTALLEDDQIAQLVATGKAGARLAKALKLLGVPENATEVNIVIGGAGAHVTWLTAGGKP